MRRAFTFAFAFALLALAAGARQARGQAAGAASAATAPPVSRRVKGRVLTSAGAPRVRIKFDKAFKYAGAQSFVLYDVANAEQHFFVDADARGHIRRLYWVQFEGYLPDNDHAYDYKSKNVVNLGGLDFVADARAIHVPEGGVSGQPPNKISDGDRARVFLASKGYTLAGGEALWQRFVHMVDASKQSEMMIIYLEDLSPMGLKAADFSKDGSAAGRWDSVSKELLERARKGVTVARH